MKITVLNKKAAATYQPLTPAILIGIVDFTGEHPRYQGNYRDTLLLKFDDIDEEVDESRFGPYKLFDGFQASKILDFVFKHKNEVNEIVVHCGAGISRSAGTAAAISLLVGQNEDEKRLFKAPYQPNRHVYRTLLNTAVRLELF